MIEKIKIGINLLPLIAISGILFGANISENTALKVANSIYIETGLLHGDREFSVRETEVLTDGVDNLIYIFHLLPKGFILVPADDQAVPNLAFGYDQNFNASDISPSLNALINSFKADIKSFVDNPSSPSGEISDKWNYYLSDSVEPSRERDVSPLLDNAFL